MSDSAIRTYPASVAEFYDWIQDEIHHQPPRRLYREHVLKFRDHLVACRVPPRTINHKLSALRKYNAYLISCKHQRTEVFKRGDFLKIRPKKPKAFDIPESRIRNFLAKVRQAGNPRDFALVTLLATSGMTLREALRLKTYHFDWKHTQVTVNAGDKKKERTIPLPEQALSALKDYETGRRRQYPKADRWAYFFAAQGSSQLTYSTVNRLFNKHSKSITPKTLRQCVQVDLLGRGATVAEVVQLTGADAQTISGLVNRQAEDLRKKLNARQL